MRLSKIAILFLALALTTVSEATADTHVVDITCPPPTAYPNPVYIHKGDAVQWTFSMSCMTGCNINIPNQLGYGGWAANGGDWQHPLGPSAPFNSLGTYTYSVVERATFSIVVSEEIPTLSEWAMIIFSVLLLGMMTYYVIRRRRVAHTVAM